MTDPFIKRSERASSRLTTHKPKLTLDQIMQDIRPGRVGKSFKRGLRQRMAKGRKKARTVRLHPHAGDVVDSNGRVYNRANNGPVVRVGPIKPWTNKAEMKQYKRDRRNARYNQTERAAV